MSRMRLEVSPLPRSTPLGRWATLLAVGLLFAGINTGNNLFYLVFALLAASELAGVLAAGRVLRRARATATLAARGQVGSPLRVTIALSNRCRRLPLPALRWRLTTSRDETTEIVTPPLAAGERASAYGRLTPSRRGALRLTRIEARTDFPLGLGRRIVRLRDIPALALIAPRPLQASPLALSHERGQAVRTTERDERGDDPHEARPYRPGDDARQIDWKATARSNTVIWRQRRSPPPRSLEVCLDRSGPPGPAFEARVSRAAGAAIAALRRGGLVALRSDETLLPAAAGASQKRRILDYLALVEPAPKSSAASRGGQNERTSR
ncbi:MAG: DUF58 domain-containing protein [Acidobacteriota bacterium]|nr:MAG: DUF58 domain-containing protein [Acidobacteriota bacterium]